MAAKDRTNGHSDERSERHKDQPVCQQTGRREPQGTQVCLPRKKQGEQWVDEAVEIPAGKYKAACWVQEAKDGSKYLSISLTQVGGAPVGGNGDIF